MDVGYQFEYKDKVLTPLLVAAERGLTSTVIRLMQLWPTSSPAYTAINKIGRNILHIAAAGNKLEMIQGILKYCPEIFKDEILKQQDDNGDTLLHLLISHGCFVPELIKHTGLDTMAKNKRNWTPLDMLYLRDDIIADQKKDVIFKEKTKLLMDEEQAHSELEKKKHLQTYKKRTNTQIIVTALITTVTFTVGFTMPGGLYQSGGIDQGLVIFSKKAAFNTFMVSDAIALLLSTSSLVFYFLESMNEDPHQVRKLNAASTGLNIVSVIAMMLTFIAGTYVVLSKSPGLAISVCVICSLFFLLIIVLSIKIFYNGRIKRNNTS
ncbi:hypothetical protein DCAR_0933530 [Daucus carota subsp. sativus]|uniref:PGG domain-containing protein n=1 Tax=Daucus carota subsp. sativus TaxID=79200 RepID=A0AAF1BC75_DAUCS|nr:hypothetical protein DCAR_0933530 [Daucus carota subsp. sativus]